MQAISLFNSVLRAALNEMKEKAVPVFTFAFYHDHESGAVSVCVDTEESSDNTVRSMNSYNVRHFLKAVERGDLKSASLWQANIGRSLSLGDFSFINIARTDIGEINVNEQFYVSMVKALVAVQEEVAILANSPERLVFACSGKDDEVAYVWSLPR